MKFTVNRKAFIEIINLAVAVAGRDDKKYKVEKLSEIPPHTLDGCMPTTSVRKKWRMAASKIGLIFLTCKG